MSKRNTADAMRRWITTLRNLAYAPKGAARDEQIDDAERVLQAQANRLADVEAKLEAIRQENSILAGALPYRTLRRLVAQGQISPRPTVQKALAVAQEEKE